MLLSQRPQQAEELEILESIFGPEQFRRWASELDESCSGCQLGNLGWDLHVVPECPLPIRVSWCDNTHLDSEKNCQTMQRENDMSVQLAHVPPLTLSVEMPRGYLIENNCIPSFTLSCDWLDGNHLTRIAAGLDQIAASIVEGDETEQVGFAWADFLREESWGIAMSDPGSATVVFDAYTTRLSISDPRVIPGLRVVAGSAIAAARSRCTKSCNEIVHTAIHDKLMELCMYAQNMVHKQWCKDLHECIVCMDELPGASFYRLGCGHFFCKQCLRSMASVSKAHAAEKLPISLTLWVLGPNS